MAWVNARSAQKYLFLSASPRNRWFVHLNSLSTIAKRTLPVSVVPFCRRCLTSVVSPAPS